MTATVTAPSSSGSASATAVATGSKSFLENKPLSISVITIATLIAIVVLFSVATLAIRKRKRDKLQADAVAFSVEELFGNPGGGSGSTDLEKSASSAGARKDSWGGSNESGSSGASTQRSLSGQSRLNGGRDMYEKAAYPAAPAYSPPPARQGYPAQNYGQPRPAYPNAMANPTPAAPPMPAYMAAPFEQSYRLNINVPEPLMNFDDNGAYDGLAYAAAPAPGPRPMGRKQPPPLQVINTTPTAVASGTTASPMDASPLSLHTSPMQPASAVNPGNPPTSPLELAVPASAPGMATRRSSLLNSPASPVPAAPKSPATQGEVTSHSKGLDPAIPPMPMMQPLPEEFGRSSPVEEKTARRLTVSTFCRRIQLYI